MTSPSRFSRRALRSTEQPISELMQRALTHPHLISLAAGFVDQPSLPVEATRAAMEAILADADEGLAALQYGTTQGLPVFREQLRQRLLAMDPPGGPDIESNQILVTAGSNQLLHLLGDTLLDEGDIVLTASPTYLVFLGILENQGAESIGVACDHEGMDPDALEEELQRLEAQGELGRVKAIYVVSYFDNPASTTLPLERRQRIVELAKRYSKDHQIYVIEDVAYRLLRYAGEDLPSMRTFDEDGTTVITADTFSKCFSPGVRVGYGVIPKDLMVPAAHQKANVDFGSPNLNQHLLAKVVQLGLLESHLETLKQTYASKQQAMLDAADAILGPIEGVCWNVPQGGLYVWLELPEGMDAGPEGTLLDAALEEGVLYVPGQYCYPKSGQPVERNRIRLSFGVQHEAGIRDGMEKLGRAIERTLAAV